MTRKKKHKRKLIVLLVAVMGLCSLHMQATANQSFLLGGDSELSVNPPEHQVTGQVTAADNGKPLPGVSIYAKGKPTQGTTTDVEGHYSISIAEEATLVFSFVGYENKEVPVDGKEQINVTLQPSVEELNEVVVIGYGEQKKKNVTGSVEDVGGSDLEKAPVMNTTQALTGRTPGLTIVQSHGEPGQSGGQVLIRGRSTVGNNSPLVVIDGVPSRPGALSYTDPSDIKNITVLKDASAAIYGARAANGVILIETKRGKKGKTNINFTANYGLQTPTVMPEMANSTEFAKFINDIDENYGRQTTYSQEDIEKYQSGEHPWTHPNFDWLEKSIANFAPQAKYNLSVNGGSERVKYYLSSGFKREKGMFKNDMTEFDQYNFRSNINGKVNKNVNLSLDLSGRMEDRTYPGAADNGFLYYNAVSSFPTQRGRWPNGQVTPNAQVADANPLIAGTDAGGYDYNKYYTLNTKFNVDVTVPWVKGLSLKSNVAIDHDFRHQKNWTHDYTVHALEDAQEQTTTPVEVGPNDPRLSESYSKSRRIFLNAQVNYVRQFGDHKVDFMAGAEQRKATGSDLSAFRRYFLGTSIDYMFAGGEDKKDNGGSGWVDVRRNFFGRVKYRFQEKYLFQFNWRYDGSENFPEGKRYGFFPGLQFGWRVSQEDFWSGLKETINYMKIRASWGQMGNDQIAEFMYISGYAYENEMELLGDEVYQPLDQTVTPNPNVTWEKENSYNLGVDMHFFDDRIIWESDFFYKYRNDILLSRSGSFPMYAGLDLPPENIGRVKNRGVETSITYNSNITKDIHWKVSLNGSFSRNTVVNWDEPEDRPEWQKVEGHPMQTPLYYETDGIFEDWDEVNSRPSWEGAEPGDVIFKDVNGDGQINSKDRVRQDYNDIPEVTFGANFSFTYKNLDLSMLWQGATNVRRYNKPRVGAVSNMYEEIANNHWTPNNRDAKWPRAWDRESMYWSSFKGANTFFWENASYLRLKNFEIGYTLPEDLTSQAFIRKFRVYVSGQNVLTFDDLSFADPEANTEDTYGYYPIMKVINFGASIKF